jgi:hypothetical protein
MLPALYRCSASLRRTLQPLKVGGAMVLNYFFQKGLAIYIIR